MKNVLIPLLPEYSIQIPQEPWALIAWFLWFTVIIYVAIKLHDQEQLIDRKKLIWLAFLSVLLLVLTPFFGIYPGSDGVISASYPPIGYLMFFAAIPWMVSGGIIGLLPAVGLAGMSGVLLAYLDTHNIFTPLILMSIALVYSWGVRQRYRTLFFRLFRFPIFGGLISVLICSGLLFIASFLSVPGSIVLRIVVSATRMPKMLFALTGMVFIGGIVSTFIGILFENLWGGYGPLETAPGEKRLLFRILAITIPLFAVLWTTLAVGFWSVTEKATRQDMVTQLTETARMVAQGISTFVDTGESILFEAANEPGLATASVNDLTKLLSQNTTAASFFDQLGLMNRNGALLARYSLEYDAAWADPPIESVVSELITQNQLSSIKLIATDAENKAKNLNFLISVADGDENTLRVFWGQIALQDHPLNIGWTNSLKTLAQDGGSGQLIDSSGNTIYATAPELALRPYQGTRFTTPTYFEGIFPTGDPRLSYYQPIPELDWAVMVSIPRLVIQEMVWQQTYPVLLIAAGTMLMVLVVTMIALWPLIKDIRQINLITSEVSKGLIDVQLPGSQAKAEMGQLFGVVGSMFRSLRKRLVDQAKLVEVSKTLDGCITLEAIAQRILEAALTQHVSSVRLALEITTDMPSQKKIEYQFGLGAHANELASFDETILEKLQKEDFLFLNNAQMGHGLDFGKRIPQPTALLAHPLKRGDKSFGTIWVTYHDGKYPDQSEINFFEELAQIASRAIKNAQKLDDHRIHLAQLELILDSVPDAVLISDQTGQIIYNNQRAKSLLNRPIANKKLKDLFEDDNLIELLDWGRKGFYSKEIQTNEGKFYKIITQPIKLNSKETGQATLITELTDQRMRDSRKSEFVTTVSHELRSPLTLIHGYAKILRLTGDLSEQQDNYVHKIINSVGEMTNLVQNLLDLGRLESGTSLVTSQTTAQELGQKITQSMAVLAKQKNITLKTSFPEVPIEIRADVTLLTQALKNLVENAIKFTKMGGSVTLSAQTNQGEVVFVVRDTGIGIAPLDQRHIFEKFKTISPDPSSETRGSGLGLAIVKSIAERHHGKVWFETQLGKGSTFYLQIPIR
jgi:signal transduction histidine kinase